MRNKRRQVLKFVARTVVAWECNCYFFQIGYGMDHIVYLRDRSIQSVSAEICRSARLDSRATHRPESQIYVYLEGQVI